MNRVRIGLATPFMQKSSRRPAGRVRVVWCTASALVSDGGAVGNAVQVALYWACPLTSRRKTKKHTKKHVVSITTSQGDYKICLLKSAPFKLKITLIHSLSNPPVVEHASANVKTVDPRVTCRDCILAAID